MIVEYGHYLHLLVSEFGHFGVILSVEHVDPAIIVWLQTHGVATMSRWSFGVDRYSGVSNSSRKVIFSNDPEVPRVESFCIPHQELRRVINDLGLLLEVIYNVTVNYTTRRLFSDNDRHVNNFDRVMVGLSPRFPRARSQPLTTVSALEREFLARKPS